MTTTDQIQDITLPKLEESCKACLGNGFLQSGGASTKCFECNGSGLTATRFGEMLLNFVWKRFDEVATKS